MGNSAGGGIRRKDRKKWMKQFNLTEADVEHELRRFKKMANKEGVITKAQYFEIVSSRMSAFGEDMLQAVFRSMDLDGDGTIDVNEWVAVAGLTAKGSVGDRLAASFRMFDEDGNGELSVAEVEAMFTQIAKVAEGGVLSDDTKADTKEVIRQIFLRFDTDKSGSLSLEEFQAGFAADPAICRYFKQF